MKKIIEICINRPITVLMFYLLLLIIGAISYTRIPINFLPSIDYPKLTVITFYENASPQEIEKMVTKPIEEVVGTINGVINVNSKSRNEVSIITIDFNQNTNISYSALDLREKLDNIMYQLPSEVQRPTIANLDPSKDPIMYLSVTNQDQSIVNDEFQQLVKNHIKNRLQQIEGVAQAEVIGLREREIVIRVDEAKINKLNLNIDKIKLMIQYANIITSDGKINQGEYQYLVKINTQFQSITDIKNTPITKSENGRVILLKDIASIEDSYKDVKNMTRYNSNYSLGIIIRKEPKANTVEVAKLVRDKVSLIEAIYEDVDINVVDDHSVFIKESINNVLQSIILGGILAFIALFLFLNNFKSPLIIAVVIPISIVITFIFMYIFDVTINIISLSGLALGIGMLVDNSIVVSENIHRHREMKGYSKKDLNKKSSLLGTKEVSLAITASTLTTLVVFIPLLFVGGMTASLFRDEALTVTLSLLSSLFVSLTLLPMLSSLEKSKKSITTGYFGGVFEKLKRRYLLFLDRLLVHKALALSIFIIIFIGSIFLFLSLDKEFFPDVTQANFTIQLRTKPGTSLAKTDTYIRNIEDYVAKDKRVESYFVSVGKSSQDKLSYFLGDSSTENLAEIKINLKDNFSDKEIITEYKKKFLTDNVELTYKKGDNFLSSIIDVKNTGFRLLVLGDERKNFTVAQEIKKDLLNKDEFSNIVSNFDFLMPIVTLNINRKLSDHYDYSFQQISDYLSANMNGNIIGNYVENNDDYDITFKVENNNNIEQILSRKIKSGNKSMLLKNLVTLKHGVMPEELSRENQLSQLEINFDYNCSLKKAETIVGEITNKYKDVNIEVKGANSEIHKTLNSLFKVSLLAIILIYLILASQFESFKLPFIVMFVAPMGIIGVALALYIAGESINIMSALGILVLVGIIVNDAILLVDFANRSYNKGISSVLAIKQAASSRLRPILMTTFTTVFGLIPMIIGLGRGKEIQSAMSISVVGGIIASTLLTLIFIPVLYCIFNRGNKNEV